MSASKSTSMMCDFTSLPEFDLMFMFAVKSYLHSWCFQCSSRPISKFLTVFACITDSGRLFHISTILMTRVYFLTFSLLVFIFIFLLCPLVFEVVFSSNISTVVKRIINIIYYFKYFYHISSHSSILQSGHLEFL